MVENYRRKEYLERVKESNRDLIKEKSPKILLTAIGIYFGYWFYKGINTSSNGYETAAQVLGRLGLGTIPTFFIVLILGFGGLWYLGKRKYDAELIKVQDINRISLQVIAKHEPFPTIHKVKENLDFIHSEPQSITPDAD